MKNYIGKRIVFFLYLCRKVCDWMKMDEIPKTCPNFPQVICVHDDVNMINKGVKGTRVFLF
jgi:hypothetical protein